MNFIGKLFKGLWHGLNFSRRLLINILFLFLIIVFIIGLSSSEDEILLEPNSVLKLNLSGYLVEELTYVDPIDAALNDASGAESEPAELLVSDVLKVITKAQSDPRINAMMLDLAGLKGGHLDKLRDVANAISSFKNAGKKVYAHGSSFTQQQYYIAAHADEISLHPFGSVYINGFASYPMYFKDALEKLKIKAHVFRVGTFKSAIEPLIRNNMSDAAKEANELWLGELWQQYKQDISKSRNFAMTNFDETVSTYLEKLKKVNGNFAQYALNNGWVDSLKTDQEINNELINLVGLDTTGDQFKSINFNDYLTLITSPYIIENQMSDKVAIVVARGTIVNGKQKSGTIGGDSTAALLKKARLNDKVKAVVLRIDSGGGSMFASEVIRNEIQAIKASGKPFVASMGSVAASGGYWIAASADQIWASPSTITGSIGVFGAFMTAEDSLKEIGIYSDGVSTTELNNISVMRGLNPELSKVFQMSVENSYDLFISLVAKERKMTKEKVDEIAQGRVWTASQAIEFGLIDKLGTKKDAIESAAKLANLTRYDVITITQTLTKKEELIKSILEANIVKNTLAHILPSSSYANVLHKLIGTSALDIQKHIKEFNDPNNIYSKCLTCEITY